MCLIFTRIRQILCPIEGIGGAVVLISEFKNGKNRIIISNFMCIYSSNIAEVKMSVFGYDVISVVASLAGDTIAAITKYREISFAVFVYSNN